MRRFVFEPRFVHLARSHEVLRALLLAALFASRAARRAFFGSELALRYRGGASEMAAGNPTSTLRFVALPASVVRIAP
jgi:hypothetical protein